MDTVWATNETLEAIARRRSIRNYTDQQLTEEELQAILYAGSYAPYAFEQLWHFSVIQKPEVLVQLNDLAKKAAVNSGVQHFVALGNNPGWNCLYGAPTLIIVSGNESAPFPLTADCAAATQNMLLAAESLGLGSCWIFFVMLALNSMDSSKLEEIGIPQGHKPYYAAIFGHKAGDNPDPEARCGDLFTYVR